MKGWRSADEGCGRRHGQPQIQTDIFHFNLYDSLELRELIGREKESRHNRHGKTIKVNYTNLFTKLSHLKSSLYILYFGQALYCVTCHVTFSLGMHALI